MKFFSRKSHQMPEPVETAQPDQVVPEAEAPVETSLTGPATPPPPQSIRSEQLMSDGLHAPRERLGRDTLHMHQAISSLREELEAVDWYRQRADDCQDEVLRAILLHNMREEIEHAMMVLEWMRRTNSDFDKQMREYLFSEDDIVSLENTAMGRK